MRGKTDQREPYRFFTTLARDLSDTYPAFKLSLWKAIKDNTRLRFTQDYEDLFKCVLRKPLGDVHFVGPIFIVIDAIDESEDASNTTSDRTVSFHKFLGQHVSEFPSNFRIFITSRPEADIMTALSPSPSIRHIQIDDENLDKMDLLYTTALKESPESKQWYRSKSTTSKPRPPILGNLNHNSTSALVGSAFNNKVAGSLYNCAFSATTTMPPPALPPPPPPICFPFTSKKSRGRSHSPFLRPYPEQKNDRRLPYTQSSALTSKTESVTSHSDSEIYDAVREVPASSQNEKGRYKLARSNTMTGTKKSTSSSKWGCEWGAGKKDKEIDGDEDDSVQEKFASQVDLPLYHAVVSRSRQSSRPPKDTAQAQNTAQTHDTQQIHTSQESKGSAQSYRSGGRSTAPKPCPPLLGNLNHHDSTSILVGSAFERKINDHDFVYSKTDTTERLDEMRRLMAKDNLDY